MLRPKDKEIEKRERETMNTELHAYNWVRLQLSAVSRFNLKRLISIVRQN